MNEKTLPANLASKHNSDTVDDNDDDDDDYPSM